MYDTIIIGTGIGGLSAGLSLARRGRSVLLLEAGKQFGGMLNPFARKHYHFDVGVHYVGEAGEGQAMRRVLDSLGLTDLRFREIDPNCIDRYVFDGYETSLVKGPDRWADLLAADFPREEPNIRRFMKLMEACKAMTRVLMNGPRARDARRLLDSVPAAADLVRSTYQPLSVLLERYFDDPLLRNVFAGPGGDIGLPPSRASGFASIMLLAHFLQGAYYPVGGSGAIRDAFVTALRGHGAELMRNQEVSRIEARTDGTFSVYGAHDKHFHARSVISNVDAKTTFDMVEGARPDRWTRRKLARMQPSLGTFCVFLATDIDIRAHGITDANIWHYGDNDIEAGYAEVFAGRMPERPLFFMTAPTLKDPDTQKAPAGHHIVELITFAPSQMFKPWWQQPSMKRGPEYQALKANIRDRLVAGAERYIPGLRDRIILEESATPATVWHFVRGREGGIYGPALTPEQSLHRRVFPSVGIPGLYLAGASVFGAGVFTCLMSGLTAARACGRHLTGSRGTFASVRQALASARSQPR
jgi:all-trans-retinol 13,14-reductase